MTDLIRKSDALAAVKKARVAYQKSTDDTPYDFFLRDAIAALPAALDEAEARAVKAEAERDAANALLREAVSKIQSLYDGIAPLGEGRFAEADETVQAARAHLGAKP